MDGLRVCAGYLSLAHILSNLQKIGLCGDKFFRLKNARLYFVVITTLVKDYAITHSAWIKKMDEEDLKYMLRDVAESDKKKTHELMLKCFRSFCLVLVCDMISSFDHYAYTHDWFYTQMVSGAISQLGWLTASFLFFNANGNRERLCIGLSECLAASIGSTLMLGWVKPWYLEFLKGIAY